MKYYLVLFRIWIQSCSTIIRQSCSRQPIRRSAIFVFRKEFEKPIGGSAPTKKILSKWHMVETVQEQSQRCLFLNYRPVNHVSREFKSFSLENGNIGNHLIFRLVTQGSLTNHVAVFLLSALSSFPLRINFYLFFYL